MVSFAEAIDMQEARTENGMKTLASSLNKCVDFFYHAGAMRGQPAEKLIALFTAAYVESPDTALRLMLWLRDPRGGAGERQLFRVLLAHVAAQYPEWTMQLLNKISEIGRWDDAWESLGATEQVVQLCVDRIRSIGGTTDLLAKWFPRKGSLFNQVRSVLGWTPKQLRKWLVAHNNVVETPMCDNRWKDIVYSRVPSRASMIYKKAFTRHDEEGYTSFIKKVESGEEKINAKVLYPYELYRELKKNSSNTTAVVQWNALPNYMGDNSVLAMVDVSGSMMDSGNPPAIDVSVSLGLYCADKLKGAFKDCFLTFSDKPELLNLRGNIVQKIQQMERSSWGMNTNLHAAVDLVLRTGIAHNVAPADMPKMLLVISDMQFDQCVQYDSTAMQMIAHKYEASGYTMPQIVFWNVRDSNGIPARYNTHGVALVSGFSPAIMKSVLAADLERLTPVAVMLKAISDEHYNLGG